MRRLQQLLRIIQYNPSIETCPLSTPKLWIAACLGPRVPHLDNKPRHRGVPPTLRPSDWGTPGRRRGGTGSTQSDGVRVTTPCGGRRRDSTHLPAAVRAWAHQSGILAGGRTRVETANLVRSQTPEPARGGRRVCGSHWGAAPSAHPCRAGPPRPLGIRVT